MAARSSWKGYLKVSLVSIPVKAYNATSSSGSVIQLNQLHEECNSRIQYRKTCPVHGEVSNDEIVKGYEFSKGRYVIVDTDELEKLRTDRDRSISVDAFVATGAIDPVYHSGRTYYLVPDGPIGQKPYALLQQSMAEDELSAIAQVVISSREQLVQLRPIENLLAMTVLEYDAAVKKPSSFEDEVVPPETSKEELKLTKMLINALTREDPDLAAYQDTYTEKLAALIEAKVEGRELVSPPQEEQPQVINLMEALKASMKQVKPLTQTSAARKKPARKTAASKTSRSKSRTKKAAAPKRKRKTS